MIDSQDMAYLASALQLLGIGTIAGGEESEGAQAYNACACEMLGLTPEALRARKPDSLFLMLSPESRQPLDFASTPVSVLEGVSIDQQGEERYLRVVRLRGPGVVWAFLFWDCSELIQAQAGNRKDFKQDVLVRLISGASHDLNNLLGGVMGSAELLFSKLRGQDMPQRLASAIIESSRNAAELSRRLSQYAQCEQERNEFYDANEAIRDSVDLLRRNVNRKINIQLRLEPTPVHLQGDPVLLRCLLLRLGLEACRGLGQGGTLDICVGTVCLTASDNPNSDFPISGGTYLSLAFRDNGAGLTSETSTRFFRKKVSNSLDDFNSTDLGQVVGALKATIRSGDVQGQGGELCLYLPVARQEPTPYAEAAEPASPTCGGGTVLLADDDELMRSALVHMINNLGFSVIEAWDGHEAVQLYMQHAKEIDFVFLDLVMPNMDGREAFLAIKSLNPQVRAIVASGFTRNSSFGQLLHDGVREILRKPFTMRELSDAIHKTLEGAFPVFACEEKGALGTPVAEEMSRGFSGSLTGASTRSGEVALASQVYIPEETAPELSPMDRSVREMASELRKEQSLTRGVHDRAERLPNFVDDEQTRINALLVEDEGVLREVLASLLEARGYNVVALSSGTEASLLLRGGEKYALCLLDLNLPGVSGMELCARVKQAAQDNPSYVLIMTGQEPQNVYKAVLHGGADDFLAKPFTLDLLSVRLDIAEKFLHNERKRIAAEKALRDSEERMTLAVENAQLGMAELDFATGRVVTSELWHKITGCPTDNPGGPLAYLRENIHPDDIEKVFRGNDGYRNMEGEVISIEFRIKQPDRGYVWLQSVGRAWRHPLIPGSCILSGFFQDISSRKQLELSQERQRKTLEDMVMERTEELVRINRELRQEMEARVLAEKENLRQQKKLMDTEKLASLGTLVSGVGHEINNPTQFIMLNMPFIHGAWVSALPVLDSYYAENPEFRLRGVPYALARERLPMMARDILEGAERIEKIVRELKDYARQGVEEKFAEVDLRKVADSAQTLLAHYIRQHTDRFSITAPAEELRVRANATRIEQVVINLVQNACLALEGRDKAVRLILRRDTARAGALVIVEDEGHGIEERHMRHLTDPFFTTRQSSGGTGLGLSICQRIIHNHRGEMLFHSVPEQGTKVTVFLPEDPEKAV